MHLLAGAVVWALPPAGYRPVLALLVVVSLGYSLLVQVLRRAPWSLRDALWQSDGGWLLKFASGREATGLLCPSTYVGVRLVILNFRFGRLRLCALPLFTDAIDPEQLRRLRQRLRAEGGKRPATPESA